MCGACAGAPPDWAAEFVNGPQRRAAVARRLTTLVKRDQIRPMTAGWVFSTPTGRSVVCRTYDELVAVVSERTGIDAEVITRTGLGSARQ